MNAARRIQILWFEQSYARIDWRSLSFEDARKWLLWDIFHKGLP